MNNVWVEKFEKFLTNDGRHRYIDKSTAKLIIEYVEKEILQSEQPIIEDVGEDVEKTAENYTNEQGINYPLEKYYINMIRNQIKSAFKSGTQFKKSK